MDIERSSAHFEQIVNDIVCVNCLIEFILCFVSFYKDINKYVYNQEKVKKYFIFVNPLSKLYMNRYQNVL